MKPLKRDLGHINSHFLDKWDKVFFSEEMIEYIAERIEAPIARGVYSPIQELIYQDLWDRIWLIH